MAKWNSSQNGENEKSSSQWWKALCTKNEDIVKRGNVAFQGFYFWWMRGRHENGNYRFFFIFYF